MSHPLTPTVGIHVINGVPMTSSRDVAEHFGKLHKNVLRDINALDCPVEFSRLNFEPRDFIDSRGKQQPMIEMTRDGFVLVAMGFTGHKAMQWKCAYISAFNALEQQVLEAMRAALLRANPTWGRIDRYKDLGLPNTDVAKLVGMGADRVAHNLRKMEACGVRRPPAGLAEKQAQAARMRKAVAA